MSRYVVIYTKDLFPADESRIVNIEASSLEEADEIIRDIPKLQRWNIQIYDKETFSFIYPNPTQYGPLSEAHLLNQADLSSEA